MMLSHLRGDLFITWIPAFAGMTLYFLMDYVGASKFKLPEIHSAG
jgi:hypothetical protein